MQPMSSGMTFERVKTAYDLELMAKTNFIVIGAGGAAQWVEDMARAGIGQFVLIDPDTVSETNLATQQTYRRDIARPKVDCIAERVKDINPTASVITRQQYLDDIGDDEMSAFRADGKINILCGFTDNFWAQARVNRIALREKIPSLCAQVYREGRGAEVTFTYPGVTPACHRCILSSRYRFYFEEGGLNEVTSYGTPIFTTGRLNAVKGFVALAMIHHGSAHPRWGGTLSRIGNRNLVQVRLDPDFGETMGLSVFDRVLKNAEQERLFFDETVWLPQEPESPVTGYTYHCPDCGGGGDLRHAVITGDTKITPPVTVSAVSAAVK